jgi:hypothetical protein
MLNVYGDGDSNSDVMHACFVLFLAPLFLVFFSLSYLFPPFLSFRYRIPSILIPFHDIHSILISEL